MKTKQRNLYIAMAVHEVMRAQALAHTAPEQISSVRPEWNALPGPYRDHAVDRVAWVLEAFPRHARHVFAHVQQLDKEKGIESEVTNTKWEDLKDEVQDRYRIILEVCRMLNEMMPQADDQVDAGAA